MANNESVVQFDPSSSDACSGMASGPEQQREEAYIGVVNKCPNCGDTVKPFQAECESCGYIFQSTQVSKSVRDLVDKIQAIHSAYNEKLQNEEMTTELEESFNDQIAKTIRDYVIPTNIEDIYNFMQLADSNVNNLSVACESLGTDSQRAIYEAWESKLEQAHDKALSTHSDSIYMDTLEAFYQKSHSGMKKKKAQAKGHFLFNIAMQNILVVTGLLAAVLAIVADVFNWHSASVLAILPVIILVFPAWFLGRHDSSKEELIAVLVGGIGCIAIGVIADGLTYSGLGSYLEVSGVVVMAVGGYQALKRMGLIKAQESND